MNQIDNLMLTSNLFNEIQKPEKFHLLSISILLWHNRTIRNLAVAEPSHRKPYLQLVIKTGFLPAIPYTHTHTCEVSALKLTLPSIPEIKKMLPRPGVTLLSHEVIFAPKQPTTKRKWKKFSVWYYLIRKPDSAVDIIELPFPYKRYRRGDDLRRPKLKERKTFTWTESESSTNSSQFFLCLLLLFLQLGEWGRVGFQVGGQSTEHELVSVLTTESWTRKTISRCRCRWKMLISQVSWLNYSSRKKEKT